MSLSTQARSATTHTTQIKSKQVSKFKQVSFYSKKPLQRLCNDDVEVLLAVRGESSEVGEVGGDIELLYLLLRRGEARGILETIRTTWAE